APALAVIYSRSLHDALPISISLHKDRVVPGGLILYDGEAETGGKELLQIKAKEIARDINPRGVNTVFVGAVLKLLSLDCAEGEKDRKSTRLNSSHVKISYAV